MTRWKKQWNTIASGAAIALAAFIGLDWVSGGILRAQGGVTQLRTAVLLTCKGLPDGVKPSFVARVSLRRSNDIELQITPFDKMLDRELRVNAIKSCESVTVRTNFLPKTAVDGTPKRTSLHDKIKPCRVGEFCLTVDGISYFESMGRVVLGSGLPSTYESLSTRALALIVGSGQADMEAEVSVDLPDRYIPESSLPSPDYMTSLAWTTMYWRANSNFGLTAPVLGSTPLQGNRGRLENIGIQLRISNPKLKRLETTLVFLFTAFFGIGFAVSVDAPIRRALGAKDE